MSDTRLRRGYLDLLRGLAVLIMIEAHVLDSWTRFPDRQTRQFAYAMVLGGFGAPLFLFLAGVAYHSPPVPSSDGRATPTPPRAPSAAAASRSLDSPSSSGYRRGSRLVAGAAALKVDILNIMGPSIMAAATIWGALTTGERPAAGVLRRHAGGDTPLANRAHHLDSVRPSHPIEAYLRPVGGLRTSCFFPGPASLLRERLSGSSSMGCGRVSRNTWRTWASHSLGIGLTVAAYELSFFPTWYPQSHFWTTSPAFFFIRLGIMTDGDRDCVHVEACGPAVRASGVRSSSWAGPRSSSTGSMSRWSTACCRGRCTSGLSWELSWVALALFCLFMLWCSIYKDRVVRAHGRLRRASPEPALSPRQRRWPYEG